MTRSLPSDTQHSPSVTVYHRHRTLSQNAVTERHRTDHPRPRPAERRAAAQAQPTPMPAGQTDHVTRPVPRRNESSHVTWLAAARALSRLDQSQAPGAQTEPR